MSTQVFGLNDADQIVGEYVDQFGVSHNFVAPAPVVVPEPSGLTAFGLAVVLICALRRRLSLKAGLSREETQVQDGRRVCGITYYIIPAHKLQISALVEAPVARPPALTVLRKRNH
jgi:hypothetical protein